MAKGADSLMLTKIQQETGTAPFIVLGIFYDGGFRWFATQNHVGYNANIVSVGSFSNQKTADSMSNSAAVSISLSDTDGVLKDMFDHAALEKAIAVLKLGFDGMAESNFLELLQGRLVGPLNWDEGTRTFSVSVESTVEGREFGYSATVEEYSDLNPDVEDTPWPIIFGTCHHVPALHVRTRTVGNLIFPIRFYMETPYTISADKTNINLSENPTTYSYATSVGETGYLYIEGGERFPSGTIQLMIEGVVFRGEFETATKFKIDEANYPKHTNIAIGDRVSADKDHQNYAVLWLDEYIPIANHHCFFRTIQGKEWYNFCVKQEGHKCYFRYKFTSPVDNVQILMGPGKILERVYAISPNGLLDDLVAPWVKSRVAMGYRDPQGGKDSWGALALRMDVMKGNANNWWSAPADVEVRLWAEDDPDIYVASLVQLTDVHNVYAKRKVKTLDGKTKTMFEQIPASYYEVQLASNYTVNSEFASAILFYRPLSEYVDQDWEDSTIYVTGTSTVGPNPIDIIEYLLRKYTDQEINNTSFIDVHDEVIPTNFALFERGDVIEICQKIAYYSRCALQMDSREIATIFLPDEPIAQWNFNYDNTELNSITLDQTPMNEIITKFTATWEDTYRDKRRLQSISESDARELERIIKFLVPNTERARQEKHHKIYYDNIDVFGLREREEHVFVYNDEDSVTTFLDFWAYRYSNCWRRVRFRTFLEGCRLQPFDGITLEFPNELGFGIIRALVESVEFSFQDKTTEVSVVIPVRAGIQSQDSSFWPA